MQRWHWGGLDGIVRIGNSKALFGSEMSLPDSRRGAPLTGWTLGPYPDTEQKRSLNVLSPTLVIKDGDPSGWIYLDDLMLLF
jgi:hypothetical protein